jgi:hypothetical protein
MVRSPCTLLCPRTGHNPAPAADMPAQQQQIRDHLYRRHRILVLGNAHAPASDHAIRFQITGSSGTRICASDKPDCALSVSQDS